MLTSLNGNTVTNPPQNVAVPNYDRDQISPGILHIGVGNFHRAHQAIYLDNLFNKGLDFDWGIIGAGVIPFDATMRQRLASQDWLSTIVELEPNEYTARVCGSMIGFAEISISALIAALIKPEIRIVTMTITEGGYFIDEATGDFDTEHAAIQHDISNAENPITVFGALIKALEYRRNNGHAPFTILSCDNLQGNGDVTKRAVIGLAQNMTPRFAPWIEDTVSFPNSMVDCITPATGERERKMVAEKFGIEDESVVVCEPFREWVLEDNFPEGRPKIEEVGAKFVSEVSPFETMKLRILNGGHAAIAYPAALLGIAYAHEAMETPLVRAYLEKVENEEIIPTIPPVPGIDLNEYFNQTLKRFTNPEVGDTISRLCLDGSIRQPKFILPSVKDQLEKAQSVRGLALEIALWCRYCCGTDDKGKSFVVQDQNLELIQKSALRAKTEPVAFLKNTGIFEEISDNPQFITAFSAALVSLWKVGTAETLNKFIRDVKF